MDLIKSCDFFLLILLVIIDGYQAQTSMAATALITDLTAGATAQVNSSTSPSKRLTTTAYTTGETTTQPFASTSTSKQPTTTEATTHTFASTSAPKQPTSTETTLQTFASTSPSKRPTTTDYTPEESTKPFISVSPSTEPMASGSITTRVASKYPGSTSSSTTSYATTDANECAAPETNDCDKNAAYITTIGNHSCICNAGFIGNGFICKEFDMYYIFTDVACSFDFSVSHYLYPAYQRNDFIYLGISTRYTYNQYKINPNDFHSLPYPNVCNKKNKVVALISDTQFDLYGRILVGGVIHIYRALPVESLDTDYMVVTLPKVLGYFIKSSVVITSLDWYTSPDSYTSVEIFSDANIPIILLNRRESYEFICASDCSLTYIKATKPVSVQVQYDTSEDLQEVVNSYFLPPVTQWGRTFTLVPYFANPQIQTIYEFTVYSVYNNTDIFILSSDFATMSRFENTTFYIAREAGSEFLTVSCSKPVLVFQRVKSRWHSNGVSSNLIIPPDEQAREKVIDLLMFFTHSELFIWISTGSASHIKINDLALDNFEYNTTQQDGGGAIFLIMQVKQLNDTWRNIRVAPTSPSTRVLVYVFDENELSLSGYVASYNDTVLFGACKLEKITRLGVQYTFTPSAYNEVIGSIEICPETSEQFGSPLATRRCTENGWDEEVLTDCVTNVNEKVIDTAQLKYIAQKTVTEETVEEVAKELALATSQTDTITSEGVDDIANSLENIANLEEPSPAVTTSVIGSVNNVMEVSEETITGATKSSTIMLSLEKQVSTLSSSGVNYTEVEDNVAVQIVSLPGDTSVNYLAFANLFNEGRHTLNTTFEDNSTRLYFKDSDIPVQSVSVSISIPTAVLQNDGMRLNANFIIYANDVLFQPKNTSKNNEAKRDVIVSQVISGNVEGEDVKDNDDNPIIIRFFINNEVLSSIDSKTNTTCVFWNESTSAWSEEGCMAVDNIEGVIVCECNHLTSFAVLLSVGGDVNSVVLDIISKIGCAISMAALALSITCFICFLTMKKLSKIGGKKMDTKIHLNLSIALFCLYLFFAVGIDSANEAFCTTTAILLHYFLVASMTWMTLEAINIIYMIKNPIPFSQGRHIPHFILAAIFLGWGLPWLPVIIVSAVDKETYTKNLPQYCYMAPGLSLYLAILLPVAILLIFNLITFVICVNFLRESSKKRMQKSTAESRTEMIALARGALAICVLLGLTWIFGFFAVGELTKVFAFLFTIFNSLQGLAIFLLFCVRKKEFQVLVCRKKPELITISTPSTGKNNRPSSSSQSDNQITAEISSVGPKKILNFKKSWGSSQGFYDIQQLQDKIPENASESYVNKGIDESSV